MTEEVSPVRVPQVMASGRGRVLQRFGLLVIAAALLTCLFGTATASALETRLLQKSFAPAGGFALFGPQGAAVDQGTGAVYVADAGGASVYVFEADGTPASSPKLTEADGATAFPFVVPTGVGVDHSGGATEGFVYVADAGAQKVVQFDAGGAATAQAPITVSSLPADGTAQSGGLANVANSGSWGPNGIAVASNGDVYVADPWNGVIDVFSSAGTFLRQLGAGEIPGAAWVALDSSGNAYVTGANGLVEFSSAGTCLNSCAAIDPAGTLGVAVDSGDNVYVSEGPKIAEYDSSGNLVATFGNATADPAFPGLQLAFGVAINSTTDEVYVVDLFPDASNNNLTYIFGPLVTVPGATSDAATSVRPDAATLNGTVDPDGEAVTGCEFEYGTSTAYGQTVPCAEDEAAIGSGTDPVLVHADVSGLNPETPYFFRLAAGNANGQAIFPGAEFSTPPAVGLSPQAPSEDEGRSITLNALVKDWSSALSDCHFEYVTEAGYQANGGNFSNLKTGGAVPCDPATAAIPVDDAEHAVSAELTGLVGNSPYRWRIVATSGIGTTSAEGSEFTTAETPPIVVTQGVNQHGATTADLNGTVNPSGLQTSWYFEYGTTADYGSRVPAVNAVIGAGRIPVEVSEQVSGLQPGTVYHYRLVGVNSVGTENGADRTFETALTAAPERAYELVTPPEKEGANVRDHIGFQASYDGEAISYTGISALSGTGAESSYLGKWVSRRSPDGWSLASTDAPQILDGFRWGISMTQAVSDDGTQALTMSLKDLAPGAVEGASNLYLHDLVHNTYTTVASHPDPQWWNEHVQLGLTETAYPFVQGTPNFDHVLIRSLRPLLSGAPENALYEFSNGELQLASVTPEGEPIEGSGLDYRPVGSHITASHDVNVISRDGSRVAFTEGVYGAAYIRENGVVTALSESRRSGDEPGTRQAAYLLGGGRDLNEIYFSSHELLDSSDPGVEYLYRYDPASEDLTQLVKVGPAGEFPARINVSSDGSTVYFSTYAALLPEAATKFAVNTYVWRDGALRFVVKIPGTSPNFSLNQYAASLDGRYLAYNPERLLDPNAAATPGCEIGGNEDFPCRVIYLYDADTEETVCVSCQASGKLSSRPMPFIGTTIADTNPYAFARSVTTKGEVIFDSPDQLVPGDTNTAQDVYEYSNERGLSLISTGHGSGSLFAAVGADGRDVFFTTGDRLVRADFDNSIDLYDARVGGGIAWQNAVPLSACGGEDCRGQATAPPAPPPGGSETTFGPGNVKPKVKHCPKGRHKQKVKGKQRCVKNKKGKKNRAGDNRRQGR